MRNNQPLVSLVIITYNSAKTILETLESTKFQTYHNVELIVSDDCSKDNTAGIVEKWIDENRSRFQRAVLITSQVNTGVSKNLNRGVQASHGEWIKSLAGDDTLKSNAIERFVKMALGGERFYCCDLDIFGINNVQLLNRYRRDYDYYFSCVSESLEQQKERILREYTIPGPGWFYSRSLYDEIGGFDEKYRLMEEWPFVYKCLERNVRINPVPEKLVNYRITDESLCHANESLGLKALFDDKRRFFYHVCFKALLKKGNVRFLFRQMVRYEKLNIGYRFQ